MALGTFNRTGTEVLMAADTLLVGSIPVVDIFCIFDLTGIMAIQTTLRIGLTFRQALVAGAAGQQSVFTLFGMMVTIGAGQTVAHIRRVGLVVKEYFPSQGVEHASKGWRGGLLGKGCITNNAHQKEVNRQTISKKQLFLGSHFRGPSGTVVLSNKREVKNQASTITMRASFQVFSETFQI
jgi:hypothetical protein